MLHSITNTYYCILAFVVIVVLAILKTGGGISFSFNLHSLVIVLSIFPVLIRHPHIFWRALSFLPFFLIIGAECSLYIPCPMTLLMRHGILKHVI